jgi:hypothetical protein
MCSSITLDSFGKGKDLRFSLAVVAPILAAQPKYCMGLWPTNGHESLPYLSFRSRMRARNLLLLFFTAKSRFYGFRSTMDSTGVLKSDLVARLLGMTGRLHDLRRSVPGIAEPRKSTTRRRSQPWVLGAKFSLESFAERAIFHGSANT